MVQRLNGRARPVVNNNWSHPMNTVLESVDNALKSLNYARGAGWEGHVIYATKALTEARDSLLEAEADEARADDLEAENKRLRAALNAISGDAEPNTRASLKAHLYLDPEEAACTAQEFTTHLARTILANKASWGL